MAVAVQDGGVDGAAGSGALALVARGREAFEAMPVGRRNRLLVCAVVLAAACAAAAWWMGRTEWKTLYSGMDGRDLQQVQGELAAAGIGYQATADGLGVEVPAELLDKARMEVASKGMPQSGRMGFELFDKPNWVGSEFDERVNYQRALEGELEHTIATIGAVRSARVHLVLPKESLFSGEQRPAKASVVLKLKSQALGREQVESMRNLVAGAVEGLSAEQVTLVDADGKANFNPRDRAAQSGDAEAALEEKLVAMLEPLAGRDNVRATVNISYDDGTTERTDEVVDPTKVSALTVEKKDQMSGSAARAGGIPGTVSNTAAAAPVNSAAAAASGAQTAAQKEALPVYPTAGGVPQSTHEESSTYAVTRHSSHEEQGPGRIVRVTAAVVVNDRAVTEATVKGPHTVWRPRTVDEMKRMEQLAQAAVGFDPQRGDQVVMQNLGFEANVPEVPVVGSQVYVEQAKSLLKEQPELLRWAGGAVLAVLMLMMVVRPVAKQTLVLLQEPKALPGGVQDTAGQAALGEGEEADRLALEAARERVGEMGVAGPDGVISLDEDHVMEFVAQQIRREPLQSTRLLEAWIGKETD